MQKQVTPAMIVVALIVLVIVIGLLWYFTMGRKSAPEEPDTEMMDPAMMEGDATMNPESAAGGGGGGTTAP